MQTQPYWKELPQARTIFSYILLKKQKYSRVGKGNIFLQKPSNSNVQTPYTFATSLEAKPYQDQRSVVLVPIMSQNPSQLRSYCQSLSENIWLVIDFVNTTHSMDPGSHAKEIVDSLDLERHLRFDSQLYITLMSPSQNFLFEAYKIGPKIPLTVTRITDFGLSIWQRRNDLMGLELRYAVF